MKSAPLESPTEPAGTLSAARRSLWSYQLQRLQPRLGPLCEAARQNDRAEFDRLFDLCFGQVYPIARRVTGDRAQAEAITAEILCELVNADA